MAGGLRRGAREAAGLAGALRRGELDPSLIDIDLGRDLFSRAWWLKAGALALLLAAAVGAARLVPPIHEGGPAPFTPSQREAAQVQAIAPHQVTLGYGASSVDMPLYDPPVAPAAIPRPATQNATKGARPRPSVQSGAPSPAQDAQSTTNKDRGG